MKFENMDDSEIREYISEQQKIMVLNDKKQNALKILNNSLYGSLGTQYFRHFNLHMAEGITLSGQVMVNTSYDIGNGFINKALGEARDWVVMSDTDSAVFNIGPLVDKVLPMTDHESRLNAACKLMDGPLSDSMARAFQNVASDTNAYTYSINMEREDIASGAFVAKKNYVLKVYDSEGTRYSTPRLSVTGLESVKSSTPEFFRGKLEEGYSFVFDRTEEEVHRFVEEVREEYMSLPVDDIAGSIGVSEIDKFIEDDSFRLGTPGHVRGAILYNNMIDKLNLTGKYSKIRAGERVKIVPLTDRNPYRAFGSRSLCYIDDYPHEILSEDFIDREGLYQKYFVGPYMRVLEVAGWNHEYVASLEDFFG